MPRNAERILDEGLVLAAQDGSDEALTSLVRRVQPALRNHAWRLTGRLDAAEEVTQDAWLAIVRGLRRLRDPAHFRGWALRIVTHKAADWIRRRERDRTLQKTVEMREPRSPPSDHETDVAKSSDDRSARLSDAIDQLSPELRAVIGLHYGESMSVAEIAHVLNIPAGTVKSRLHAARQQLKQRLERNEP